LFVHKVVVWWGCGIERKLHWLKNSSLNTTANKKH